MSRLRISVAMCTYRGERYLREQLDSLSRQTRLPDELVICDDDSRDQTLSIISSFAASAAFPVTCKCNKSNVGSTRNFQNAIALCNGEIIALADQDDVWHADKLMMVEGHFLSSPDTGAVFSNARIVNESLSPLGYTLWDSVGFTTRQKKQISQERAFEALLNHNVVTGATMAFRSPLRDRIFPIPEEWVHDAWIAIVLSLFSGLRFIDSCLMDYRQHDSQQIGGLKSTIAGKTRLASSIDGYEVQIRQCRLLAEHVERLRVPRNSYRLEKIADKRAHLEARTAMYANRGLASAGGAVRELLKGRYHQYSSGFASLAKDLFMIGKRAVVPKKPRAGFPGSS